jgi:hypothetical protein
MRGMGFEPMQFALTELETVSLTTRTSSLMCGRWDSNPRSCLLRPQRSALDRSATSTYIL